LALILSLESGKGMKFKIIRPNGDVEEVDEIDLESASDNDAESTVDSNSENEGNEEEEKPE
jgi:hypothetical protein